ncbi:MAG: DUF2267 domain-containing protein [Dehalococcoidia bacterium]|nr:DUF2267 domain-containing protein [Dehalococcoidia bacterium]
MHRGQVESCLHQVRDRLQLEEVAHLGAQLPMLVRGIYYEGWDPSRNPRLDRTADEVRPPTRLKAAIVTTFQRTWPGTTSGS